MDAPTLDPTDDAPGQPANASAPHPATLRLREYVAAREVEHGPGERTRIAGVLGVSRQRLDQLLRGELPSGQTAALIERESGIPIGAWPWLTTRGRGRPRKHKEGKPCP